MPLTAAYSTWARSAPGFMFDSMKRKMRLSELARRHGESTSRVEKVACLSLTTTAISSRVGCDSTMTSGMLNWTESSAA